MFECVAGDGVGRGRVGESGLWLQRRDLTCCSQLPAFLEIQQGQSSVNTSLADEALVLRQRACPVSCVTLGLPVSLLPLQCLIICPSPPSSARS